MPRRIALIYNPTKTSDVESFVDLVTTAVQESGDELIAVVATTEKDPGEESSRKLAEAGAELILAAGGDGTIRSVTAGLVNTEVSCAMIPLGTGNLMARNLDIPLDTTEAVEIALAAPPHPVDAVQLIVDGRRDEAVWFTGMAGVGFDAAMMRDTDEELKKFIGPAAYLVAFAKHIAAPPHRVRIQIDARSPIKRRPVLVMVGNTHSLQGNLALFPDATPDDGVLDLVTATPYIPGAWGSVFGAFFKARYARRKQRAESKAVQFEKGKRITMQFNTPQPWEVDGDTMGTGSHFQFTVHQHALKVITPLDDLGLNGR